jgi:hypothetical protein
VWLPKGPMIKSPPVNINWEDMKEPRLGAYSSSTVLHLVP